MPFASEPAPITHTGNGSSTTQAISFVYYEKSHVVVKRRSAADTALTTLVLDTDYTLTAAGDENGGTLTFTSAPATGVKTFIYLDIPNTQSTRYKQGGADSAATKNADLDKLVQRIAFLEEAVKRAWKLPLTDYGSDMEGIVEKASLLGLLARFNSSTGKLEGVASSAFVAGSYTIPLDVVNGGTGAASASAARANLSALGGALGSTDNALLRSDGAGGLTAQGSVITVSDAGDLTDAGTAATTWLIQGTGGPIVHRLDRTDTHGDNVLVATYYGRGRDSGGATQDYGAMNIRAVLDNAGAETGGIEWQTGNAGTLTDRLLLRLGLYTANATDGDKGADSINAGSLWQNGVRAGVAQSSNVSLNGTTGTTFSSLPADLNWIDVIINGWSLDDTDNFLVRIGDSGGMHTTGYDAWSAASISSTAGFVMYPGNAATDISYGIMSLRRVPGTHIWVAAHAIGVNTDTSVAGGGNVTLDTALDRLQVLDTGGDLFDGGTVALMYG